MFLPAADSFEYATIIWIIAELAILIFIISKNTTKQINPRILSAVGLSVVIGGTFFFLIFNLIIFTVNEVDFICHNAVLSSDTLLEDIENNLLGNKLNDCYEKYTETKWNYFTLSIIASMVIVFGTVLQAISRRD